MATITVKIQDKNASALGEFIAEEGKSIAQMADMHNIDIPLSCGAGACFVCAVKVLAGKEFLQQDLISPALVDLEEDQFLTCIGGVKAEMFQKEGNFEVVLQKIL
ncbi:MAG: 2Fe-2S iron-sulfur cluster binding domain-containing protein [bacterium]|nr:2Fe-2S iron-sulfur cluster binding domain-containing protein [bacterium]